MFLVGDFLDPLLELKLVLSSGILPSFDCRLLFSDGLTGDGVEIFKGERGGGIGNVDKGIKGGFVGFFIGDPEFVFFICFRVSSSDGGGAKFDEG